MGDWQDLEDQLSVMTIQPAADPGPLRRPRLKDDRFERPSIFVRSVLAGGVIFVFGGMLIFAKLWWFNPSRQIPDYRRAVTHRAFRSTAVGQPSQSGGPIWIPSLGGGAEPFTPSSLSWESPVTSESSRGALSTNKLWGAAVNNNMVMFTPGDGTDEVNSLRGANIAVDPGGGKVPEFWKTSFLDLSHAALDLSRAALPVSQPTGRKDEDLALSSIELGSDKETLLVGTQFDGINVYKRLTRQWLAPLNAASGKLSDDHVHDLCRTNLGVLVANGKGIDVCSDDAGRWALQRTLAGLSSRGVLHLYPIGDLTDPQKLDLWYGSVGQGVGALTLLSGANATNQRTLISERAVPALTEQVCSDAAFNDSSRLLWVAFYQAGGTGLARYRFADHDWLGTQQPLITQANCIAAFGQSGLLGTDDGVLDAFENNSQFQTLSRGPAREKITEIVDLGTGLIAHSQWAASGGNAPTRVRRIGLDRMKGSGSWQWSDLLGPRRFAALTEDMILCAAKVPDTHMYLFGTRGQGIGGYLDDSHELVQLYHSDAASPEQRLPDDTIGDIACLGKDQFLAVTGNNAVLRYDGRSWDPVLSPRGMPGTVESVTAAAGDHAAIAVAADPNVGIYDLATHTWKQMPPLPGTRRLQATPDRLWALDEARTLHVASIKDAGPWNNAADDVTALGAGPKLVAALAGKPGEVKRLLKSRDARMDVVLNPKPLDAPAMAWRSAAADGKSLYLGGDGNAVALYDFATHQWQSLGGPASAGRSQRLEATHAGLWMLDSKGGLYLWRRVLGKWIDGPIQRDVRDISCDGSGILAAISESDKAENPRLVRFVDEREHAVFVGKAFKGNAADTFTAVTNEGMVFLGSRKTIARYDDVLHDWANYPMSGTRELKSLRASSGHVYGLAKTANSNDGRVFRYSRVADAFAAVRDPLNPQGEDLASAALAAGENTVAIQRINGDVLVALDSAPDALETAFPSSPLLLGNRRVSCAAEWGSELALGCDDGSIWDYRHSADNQLRWSRAPDAMGPPSAVNKVVPLDDRMRFVVRDASIQTQARTAGKRWMNGRTLIDDVRGCDAWLAGDGKLLYAGVSNHKESDKKAGCYSEVGFAFAANADPQRIVGDALIAEPMPLKNTTAAAEVKIGTDTLIFRADAGGILARYSTANHAWAREKITGVTRLITSIGTVWAFAPADQKLYRFSDGEWTVVEAKAVDVVGDAAGLLVRLADSSVKLTTATETRPLIGTASEALAGGWKAPRAFVEFGDALICAFGENLVCAYDLKTHAWTSNLCEGGISQFLKSGLALYALPANPNANNILQWSEKDNRFAAIALPPQTAAVRLLDIDGRLGLSTRDGGLHLWSRGAWVTLAGGEKRLPLAPWGAITCAAEASGKLVLGLSFSKAGAIARWDPQASQWKRRMLEEGQQPIRFLPQTDKAGPLLLVCSNGKGSKMLLSFDAVQGVATPMVVGLGDVIAGDQDIWCLSEAGSVSRFDPVTRKFTLPDVGAVALPGEIRQVRGIENDLVAVLGDNSVWHHDVNALGWRLALNKPADAPAGFQRHARSINNHIVFTDPSGDLFLFEKGKYVKLGDDVQLPPQSPLVDKWTITLAADRSIQNISNASFPQLSFSNGALACDVIKELAWNNGALYCRTAAGPVRVLNRQMIETGVSPAEVMKKFAPPSPLVFAGKSFTCAIDPNGLWPSAQQGVALKITEKQPDATLADLVPYTADGQSGLDFQWIQSAVYRDQMLLAAIPGGTLRASIVNDQLTDFHSLGRAPGQSLLAVSEGVVYCKTGLQILMFDRVNKKFVPPANAAVAQAAFGAGAELDGSSAVGPVWSLQRTVEGFPLKLRTGDRRSIPVGLDSKGFGFDVIAGMSLKPDVIELYTRDGLVVFKRQQPGGLPDSIDRSLAVSGEMLAQPCQSVPPVLGKKVILVSADGKSAWGLGDRGWEKLDMQALLRAQDLANPRLLDGQFCKWSRDEKVEFNGKLKTEFLPDVGRFAIDQVFSIAVFAKQSWAITRSGICRLGDNGAVDLDFSDAGYDWSKGGKLLVNGEQGHETLYARLTTRAQKAVVLKYAAGAWQAVGQAESDTLLKAAHDEFLHGQTWRVRADDVNGGPQRILERHWDWSRPGEFMAMKLIPEQDAYRFDFERINGLELHGGTLWVATDAGVMHVDPATRKPTFRSLPGNEATVAAIAMRQDPDGRKVLGARAGGKTFTWDEINHGWAAAADVVWTGPQPLVDSPLWKIRGGEGQAMEFQHLFADGKMTPVTLAVSGLGHARFDFDLVNAAVGSDDVLALSTDRGLMERLGADHKEVFQVLPRGPADDLFTYGPREAQEIVCQSGPTYYRRNLQRRQWTPIPGAEADQVRALRDKVVAWNATWQVQKDGTGLAVLLKLPEPVRGEYQPVVYSTAAGLFTFDIFNDVAVMNDSGGGIIMATDGGVVRMDATGAWLRLFNDAPGGIGPGVAITELAGLNPSKLMAAGRAPGGRALFTFAADTDHWEQASSSDAESASRFAKLRSTLADDETGWRVLDLGKYRNDRGLSGRADCKVGLAWRGQPVWLVPMQTNVGFAHDIVYSAAVGEDAAWFGTAGGVINYSLRGADLDTIAWEAPAIHASDLLGEFDPWAPPAPPRTDIVRKGVTGTVFACRAGEPPAFHSLRQGDPAFAAVDNSSADLQPALQSMDGLSDAFWHWRKTGALSLSILFQKAGADVPANYEKIAGGTFRFFDAAYSAKRTRHQRTMEVVGKQIFLATAGGVTCLDGATFDPLKLYAQAGSQLLKDVRELYFDRRQGVLYARDDDGAVFSRPAAGDDHFTPCAAGADPFADANVIVDNSLLKWRQLDKEAAITLNCSDILPGAPYAYFFDGKFSFDYVQTLAFHGDKVWVATKGGVVRMDRATRQIEHIYVQAFPYPAGEKLPGVREIVADPGGNGDLCARTDSMRCFKFADQQWQEQSPALLEPSFRRAYTRIDQNFWTWVQPLKGIYVEMHKTSPVDLDIGSACPTARVPLMSRARFAWDDLRESVLTDEQLLFSTPAGVCCYNYDAVAQQAAFDCLYADAAVPGQSTRVPMIGLERLVREQSGDLEAWNREQVFVGKRVGSAWQWTLVPGLTPAGMISNKKLLDVDGSWNIQAQNKGTSLLVTFTPTGGSPRSMTIAVGDSDAVPDVSKVVSTSEGLWCPSNADVIWVDKGLFKLQSRVPHGVTGWIVQAVVAIVALVLLGCLIRAFKKPAPGKQRRLVRRGHFSDHAS